MRIDLGYTTVTEGDRRLVAHHLGKHGSLASRDEMRDFLTAYGESFWDDLSYEHEHCTEGCRRAEDMEEEMGE
jgi:hypothetical protein